MDPVEHARLAWQRAHAEVKSAQAELESRVADRATPDQIATAHDVLTRRRKAADLLLQRYITQIGKS